jgi:hypothetical protein
MSFKSVLRAYFVPRSRVVEFGIGIGTALVFAAVAMFCLSFYNGTGLKGSLFSPIFFVLFFWIAPIAFVPAGPEPDHNYGYCFLLVVLSTFVANFFLRGLWLRAAVFVLTLAWLWLGAWAAGSNF